MRLSLGISTCPNDTYIYENLIRGLEHSPFEWDVHFADVQTLNEMVQRGELDVAKVSAQVYPKVEEGYVCLDCGGAIGYGCGPLLLSAVSGNFDAELPVTLPGADTTAALLYRFWHRNTQDGPLDVNYALFDQVYRSLLHKQVAQGVVIHEHRFTWKRDGLYLLQDLGAFWERETGTPIPLGIAVTKRTLGAEVIMQVESEIRESLRIARGRENLVTPFIDEKAQIDDFSVMEAHIRMFVNDFSENVGESGKRALENLWRLVRGE
ncbi:1,4-dihydroxy-6-naphthoate synthase [uncultured Fibrobacter sp.]|uniref:1,4-dihydroxy-6-naphthoate synthase n=1 Tax=uncultured Fibrobacter sp. TaxID=261512 RepID=UPI0026181A38|nr:1,4-dihydroxy-6-naphthoate synthase [uncultured Fibrobacter sp.]